MIKLYDTTLRDGEQMPGVVFTKEQKVDLAKKLDSFGIDIIGIMPAVSKGEEEVASLLIEGGLGDKLIAATMMRKDHIDIAYRCGVKKIVLFTSLSDIHLEKKLGISREENMKKSLEYVDYSLRKGFEVYFAGEDCTRADFSYMTNFINSLAGKIKYFLPCDTLGILTPSKTYNFIKNLKKEIDSKLCLHIHNDFGCATANSLAGLDAGAEMVSGTFTGIGERAGNAALEEIVLSLKYQYNLSLPIKYELIGKICSLVEKYSGVRLQRHKPIVGENAFAHESGTHVDGILKCLENYEIMNPFLIGKKRNIVFGKHSGLSGLKYLFENKFCEEELIKMLQIIKKNSIKNKKAFSEEEIKKLFN